MDTEIKDEFLEYKSVKKDADTILKSSIEREIKLKELSKGLTEERNRI